MKNRSSHHSSQLHALLLHECFMSLMNKSVGCNEGGNMCTNCRTAQASPPLPNEHNHTWIHNSKTHCPACCGSSCRSYPQHAAVLDPVDLQDRLLTKHLHAAAFTGNTPLPTHTHTSRAQGMHVLLHEWQLPSLMS